MANEVSITCTLSFSKGSLADAFELGLKQATMSGADFVHKTQLIGTSEEAIQLGSDIGTNGWFMAVNRDPTNFIKIRAATGVADTCKLLPGEPCLFRLAGAAPYAIADTGACQLEYLLIEE
jgi:hypothetical protein